MSVKMHDVVRSEARRFAVKVEGNGTPFIWGHTLMGSMAQDDANGVFGWSNLTDIAKVIRFDALRHGQSQPSTDPTDHTWERRAEDLWEVIGNYVEQEPVVLGGASMGSATALHAACQYPDRVKALVLVIPPTAWKERERQSLQYQRMSRLTSVLGGNMFKWLAMLAKVMENRQRRGFREQMEHNTVLHMNFDQHETLVAALNGAAESDLPPAEELKKLSIPTLILAWPHDRIHPMTTAKKLKDLLPDAELSVARRKKDPFQWGDTVRDFLTALDS